MDKKNEMVAEYENALRAAEKDIEKALRAVCPLRGAFPRGELNEALEKVQNALRDAWMFYDNDGVEIAD